MRNIIIAIGVVGIYAVGMVAWADDSGHAGPMSLKAQQSEQNGTAGQTTDNRTGGDAATTPGANGKSPATSMTPTAPKS